jgi:HEAT repeat protein
VVQALISALASANEHEERDSVILALGATRRKEAVPALEGILRDPSADGDTRHTAAEALGHVVRRRFDRQPDPLAAAVEWLDRRG